MLMTSQNNPQFGAPKKIPPLTGKKRAHSASAQNSGKSGEHRRSTSPQQDKRLKVITDISDTTGSQPRGQHANSSQPERYRDGSPKLLDCIAEIKRYFGNDVDESQIIYKPSIEEWYEKSVTNLASKLADKLPQLSQISSQVHQRIEITPVYEFDNYPSIAKAKEAAQYEHDEAKDSKVYRYPLQIPVPYEIKRNEREGHTTLTIDNSEAAGYVQTVVLPDNQHFTIKQHTRPPKTSVQGKVLGEVPELTIEDKPKSPFRHNQDEISQNLFACGWHPDETGRPVSPGGSRGWNGTQAYTKINEQWVPTPSNWIPEGHHHFAGYQDGIAYYSHYRPNRELPGGREHLGDFPEPQYQGG